MAVGVDFATYGVVLVVPARQEATPRLGAKAICGTRLSHMPQLMENRVKLLVAIRSRIRAIRIGRACADRDGHRA